MSVAITEKCITCGACEWECPNEAISPGALRPVVDESLCTECYGFFGESQCMVVCPAEAITVQCESREDLADKYARLQPAQPAQDTGIWRRLTPGASGQVG